MPFYMALFFFQEAKYRKVWKNYNTELGKLLLMIIILSEETNWTILIVPVYQYFIELGSGNH